MAKHPDGAAFAYTIPVSVTPKGEHCFKWGQKYSADQFAVIEHNPIGGGCYEGQSIKALSIDPASKGKLAYSAWYGKANTRCVGGVQVSFKLIDQAGNGHSLTPLYYNFGDIGL